jgi:hypothetical protein
LKCNDFDADDGSSIADGVSWLATLVDWVGGDVDRRIIRA